MLDCARPAEQGRFLRSTCPAASRSAPRPTCEARTVGNGILATIHEPPGSKAHLAGLLVVLVADASAMPDTDGYSTLLCTLS